MVDDAAGVRAMLVRLLAAEADFVVVGEAEDGAAGLALADRLDPDLVLLDVDMPVLGGFAAMALLRARHPRTPVVLYSAAGQPGMQATALALGAAGFVAKGDGYPVLLAALRQAAGRPACGAGRPQPPAAMDT